MSVRGDTEAQILSLRQLNVELKQQITDQEDAFADLMESQRDVADLQGKMCTASDARTKCTGGEADLDADCCIALDTLDCEVMFSDPLQVAAKSQCDSIVMTLHNHDEQLRAIKEVDENQSTAISSLLDDIKNLSQQVEVITASIEEVSAGLSDVQGQVASVVDVLGTIDARLLLLEFKAARSEAISGLNERNDHYLAWITKRYSDVRNQYCRSRSDSCLLYTSPSPRDQRGSRMPSSA